MRLTYNAQEVEHSCENKIFRIFLHAFLFVFNTDIIRINNLNQNE